MKKIQLLLFLILFVFVSFSQEDGKVENVFQGTRFIHSQSANLAEKGELLMLLQHRFGDIDGGLYQLFGLDQALMRIGFEYGLNDNLNIGIGRSTFMKTYDVSGKFQISQQNSDFPLSLAISAESSIPTIRDYFPENKNNFSEKLSYNAAIHIAKTFKKFGVQISPGFLKSGYLPVLNENKNIFILGLGSSFAISRKVSLNMEYLYNSYKNTNNKNPLSIGVDIDTGGHLFQLVFGNTQAMFTQALHTQTTGNWEKGNLFFGFNLIREFNLKYY